MFDRGWAELKIKNHLQQLSINHENYTLNQVECSMKPQALNAHICVCVIFKLSILFEISIATIFYQSNNFFKKSVLLTKGMFLK